MVGGLTFTIRVRAHLHQSSLRLVGSAVDPRLAGTAICSATASPRVLLRVFDRAIVCGCAVAVFLRGLGGGGGGEGLNLFRMFVHLGVLV